VKPEKFARIAESLRQYRRAELKEFDGELGDDPVKKLYVDPLPGNAVLTSVLSSNTTFLLGRKGTGKSTIIARAQIELRGRQDSISIYIDVKSLYDVFSTSSTTTLMPLGQEVDAGVLKAHMLRKTFLASVLSELLKEVDDVCERMSLWDRWVGPGRSYQDIKKKISDLRSCLGKAELKDTEIPVLQAITKKYRQRAQSEQGESGNFGGGGSVSPIGPSAQANASVGDFEKTLDDREIYEDYSEVVLRSFPFAEILADIRAIIDSCGLKRLVVFFDDFSELGFIDQRLFVDIILTPLNNSSGELVKLKIAGYPGRVYYGKIDSTKVDTIALDFCDLYEDVEVQSMERSAIDHLQRLLDSRFEAFGERLGDYFDEKVPLEQHVKLLFEATFNVPRLVGALLHICYLDSISKGMRITGQSIRLAARKYYESTIYQYFDRMNRFALEPFENKLDRHNQQALLKCLIGQAREVRAAISEGRVGGSYFNGLSLAPVSHFFVTAAMAHIFQSLESNFLLSRYKNTRDKDGKAGVVFALYYGLTESERISWGYPAGRDYRNYFVQRCFDYSAVVQNFLAKNQTIKCDSCGTCFPLEQRESIELYKWRCPECRDGICRIVGLADDFREEVAGLRDDLMLDPIELNILSTLNDEDSAMRAGEIGALIDATHQMVGRRTSKLRDLKLVSKQSSAEDGAMRSRITPEAKSVYFSDESQANESLRG
jgi:hypothetical protein